MNLMIVVVYQQEISDSCGWGSVSFVDNIQQLARPAALLDSEHLVTFCWYEYSGSVVLAKCGFCIFYLKMSLNM